MKHDSETSLSSNSPNAATGHLVTKAELAAILQVTKRSVTDYVARGALPAPLREGRHAVWDIEGVLANAALAINKNDLWSVNRVARLREHALALKARSAMVGIDITGVQRGRPSVPIGQIADDGDEHQDWRQALQSHNKYLREQRAALQREYPNRADRNADYHSELQHLNDGIEENERQLKTFIAGHRQGRFLGSSPLLTLPIFTVGNRSATRDSMRALELRTLSLGPLICTGPELRQEDGLVFLALVRISQDVRPGRSVGFIPGEVCQALFGFDNGVARRRLRECIGRLQDTKLSFETFSVQLAGRFDYPPRGPWRVALDRDILRLFENGLHVWLEDNKRLNYGSGLASFLYGYVCSHTVLIPTKLERLRTLSGSRATSKAFRDECRDALAVLSAGGDIDVGWFIDKHDRVHWRKPPK